MSLNTELKLAETRHGRIIIHLMGLADHHLKSHLKGIWREVTLQGVGRLHLVR